MIKRETGQKETSTEVSDEVEVRREQEVREMICRNGHEGDSKRISSRERETIGQNIRNQRGMEEKRKK